MRLVPRGGGARGGAASEAGASFDLPRALRIKDVADKQPRRGLHGRHLKDLVGRLRLWWLAFEVVARQRPGAQRGTNVPVDLDEAAQGVRLILDLKEVLNLIALELVCPLGVPLPLFSLCERLAGDLSRPLEVGVVLARFARVVVSLRLYVVQQRLKAQIVGLGDD